MSKNEFFTSMDSPVQYVYSDICRCWLGRIPSINHLYREIIPENKSNHRKLFIMLSKVLPLSLLRKDCPFLKPGVAFSFISLFCDSSDKLWSRVAADYVSYLMMSTGYGFHRSYRDQRTVDWGMEILADKYAVWLSEFHIFIGTEFFFSVSTAVPIHATV